MPYAKATERNRVDGGGGSQSRSTDDVLSIGLGVAVAFGLCLLVPVIGGLLSPEPPILNVNTVACVATMWLSGGNLATLLARGDARLSQATFWMFTYISFGVAGFSQAALGLYPAAVDDSLIPVASLVVLLGCASFWIGARLEGSVRGARRIGQAGDPRNLATSVFISDAKLNGLAIASIPLTIFYISSVGGPSTFFKSRRDLAYAFSEAGYRDGSQVGSALLLTLGTIPVFLAMTMLLATLLREGKRTSPARWALCLGTIILNVIVNNPISNARYWVLTVVFGLIFGIRKGTARRFRSAFLCGIVFATIIFPYSDYFRAPAEERMLQTRGVLETLATKDYDQLIMTANGLWFSRENGFQYGRQLSGVIVFPIPRSIWQDKPLDTGVLVGKAIGSRNVNLSSPLWMEAWVDFGIVGVILVLFAAGWLASKLDENFLRQRELVSGRIAVSSVVVPVMSGYIFILLRGPLLQSMSRLSVLLALFAVVSVVDKSERAAPRP